MTKLPGRWAAVVLVAGSLVIPPDASAIPAFARRYGVSCTLCHGPAPRLTEFGERFAGNGFQFTVDEEPRDTLDTGDELLTLLERIRFAFRFDAFAVAQSDGPRNGSEVDLQTPWLIKLLSGGPIADRISYYMYFFMSERGTVKGLEDAYLQFTDIGRSGVSAIVGQFQVSDPLFKRELRLEYEDYQAYRLRVGDVGTDLTYDRGVMLLYSPWEGNDVAFQVVNGEGLREGDEFRLFDRDRNKNFMLRLSQDLGPVRLGVFGLAGREAHEDVAIPADDRILMWGPDATIRLFGDRLEFNLQYLRRWDDNAFLTPDSALSTTVDAGFAELVFSPRGLGGRWFFTGLYNHIDASAPVVSLRLGEQKKHDPPFIQQYRTFSAGVHWLLRRNFRLTGELGWDFEEDGARLVAGFVTAF